MSDNEEDIFKSPDSDSESDDDNDSTATIENDVENDQVSDDEKDQVSDDDEKDEDNEENNDIIEKDDDDDSVVDSDNDNSIVDSENEDDDDIENNKKSLIKNKKNIQISNDTKNLENDTDDDEDSDEEMDEHYLQKFDQQIQQNYIEDFHPECLLHNYQEISALSKVVRDKNNIIIDPLHKTIPFLTKYERTRVIGQRAKQINAGAKPFVKVGENVIDGEIIANLELIQKRIPFIIRRPFPGGGGCEYWNLRDLEIL